MKYCSKLITPFTKLGTIPSSMANINTVNVRQPDTTNICSRQAQYLSGLPHEYHIPVLVIVAIGIWYIGTLGFIHSSFDKLQHGKGKAICLVLTTFSGAATGFLTWLVYLLSQYARHCLDHPSTQTWRGAIGTAAGLFLPLFFLVVCNWFWLIYRCISPRSINFWLATPWGLLLFILILEVPFILLVLPSLAVSERLWQWEYSSKEESACKAEAVFRSPWRWARDSWWSMVADAVEAEQRGT